MASLSHSAAPLHPASAPLHERGEGISTPVPSPRSGRTDVFPELAPAERRLAMLVVQDRSRGAISRALGWKRATVSTALYRLMGKLKVNGIAGLTRLAIRRGYVTP